jgi:hypothetical protein
LVAVTAILNPFSPNPVPEDIKGKVDFKVITPRGGGTSIDSQSWGYSDQQKSLSFTLKTNSYTAIVTEEKVPLEFKNDQASYNRFIGTLRPKLNFDSALGSVSVANFVSASGGNFQPEGVSGILKTRGTLVIVHPNRNLTDDEWEKLFASLRVTGGL